MQSREEFHTAGSASGLSPEPARYQKSEIIKVDLEAVLNYMGKQFNNCYQNQQMSVDSGCCLPHGPLSPLFLYTQVPYSQSALADLRPSAGSTYSSHSMSGLPGDIVVVFPLLLYPFLSVPVSPTLSFHH